MLKRMKKKCAMRVQKVKEKEIITTPTYSHLVSFVSSISHFEAKPS